MERPQRPIVPVVIHRKVLSSRSFCCAQTMKMGTYDLKVCQVHNTVPIMRIKCILNVDATKYFNLVLQ